MSFIIVEGSLFMDHNDFYCMCNSLDDYFWEQFERNECQKINKLKVVLLMWSPI